MTMFARLVLILSLAVPPGLAMAADPQDISWHMLAPPAAVIENPFENLTDDQMDTLRHILRFEALAEQSYDASFTTEAQALREQLAKDGIDVDGLFAARLAIMEKREAAASAVNEALIGSSIRMPGYVLPLEFKDRKVVEFLLVPTVGACIHTPPPPANQIVHVVYPDGIEVNGLSLLCGSPGPWSPRVRFRTSGTSTDRPRFPSAIRCSHCWSKGVAVERRCTGQIGISAWRDKIIQVGGPLQWRYSKGYTSSVPSAAVLIGPRTGSGSGWLGSDVPARSMDGQNRCRALQTRHPGWPAHHYG